MKNKCILIVAIGIVLSGCSSTSVVKPVNPVMGNNGSISSNNPFGLNSGTGITLAK